MAVARSRCSRFSGADRCRELRRRRDSNHPSLSSRRLIRRVAVSMRADICTIGRQKVSRRAHPVKTPQPWCRIAPKQRPCVSVPSVDTEAVMPVLPQNVVERLGVRTRRTAIFTYVDERKEERPVAGPLTIHVCNRFMSTDCVVGPPLSEALIGRIVLEALDLIADCTKRTLTPRPESPDYPLLKLK